MKKKKQIKKRRHISSDGLFQKKKYKNDLALLRLDASLRETFPDPEERQKYIRGVIEGLDREIANGSQDE